MAGLENVGDPQPSFRTQVFLSWTRQTPHPLQQLCQFLADTVSFQQQRRSMRSRLPPSTIEICKPVRLCIVIVLRRIYRCFPEFLRVGAYEWGSARPGQFFVDHGIKIFQDLPSLRSLLCLFRTTRVLYNPSIALKLCNGSTSLHVLDLELSAEDLETILQQVIANRSYKELSNGLKSPSSPNPTCSWPDLGLALSPC